MISRRRIICSGLASALLPVLPTFADDGLNIPEPVRKNSKLDQLVPLIEPYLDLYNPHTKEREKVRFFGASGYDLAAVNKINHLLRDWRQDQVVQMDVRLYWGLAAIRTAAVRDGLSGEIRINSGFRTKRTNDYLRSEGYRPAVNSLHLRGRAVDFVVKGGDVANVARYAQWLEIGGTGHYRGRFIHVDSGDRRVWFG
ncbi:MAG: YcbK family protein [Rhodobacteraceae bacterium]|nr:YcbK family protein [Paracoccaceae bacterium]